MILNKLNIILALIVIVSCVPPPASSNKNIYTRQFSNYSTIEQIIEYFDTTNDLDDIEGIWVESFRIWSRIGSGKINFNEHIKNFKYAIIRKNNSPNEFQKIYLSSRTCAYCQFGEVSKNINIIKTGENKYRVSNNYYGWNLLIDIENGKKMMWDYEYVESGIWFKYKNIYEKEYPIKKEKSIYTGSGFTVSADGIIVTNYHVVENSDSIFINFSQRDDLIQASILNRDVNNDIAILKVPNFEDLDILSSLSLPISFANNTRVGQEVYTIGFPLSAIMGDKSRVSFGRVNSLYGVLDDPRLIQISNPIQPGNSGGPLFNLNGELVGIVVSGLNAKYFYDNLGIIPQNVNFAIKNDYLRPLLNNSMNSDYIVDSLKKFQNIEIEKQIDIYKPNVVQIIAK